jgi:HEAT repeat protein
VISLGAVSRLSLQNAIWRATGLSPAGRAVLRGLEHPDPNVRTIAGMYLVRAGLQAEPLLREAIAARQSLPVIATIMGDIGDRRLRPILVDLTGDADPAVARAARDALRALELNSGRSRSGGV